MKKKTYKYTPVFANDTSVGMRLENVANEVLQDSEQGSLERMGYEIRNIRRALGRMLDVLADSNTLTLNQVKDVLNMSDGLVDLLEEE